MKIFLEKKSFFTFRGIPAYEVPLLGKSVDSLMRERLSPEADAPEPDLKEDYVVLYPVYPFLERETLFCYLEEREGSYAFPGGYVKRAGKELSPKARKSSGALGRGLFSLADLAYFLEEARRQSASEHLKCGALIEEGAVVSFEAKIAPGAIVQCGARVLGACTIGEGAEIGSGSTVENAVIGDNTQIFSSMVRDCEVGKNCTVGPFAYLRAGSKIGDGCRIGDFVEIKNSVIGKGGKAAHLAYVGDAQIGEKVNIGCGAVFANYDGRKKSEIRVGNGCFIGANCNLIAPLALGDHVFLAAGTTLAQDLNENDFCIGRVRPSVKSQRGRDYFNPQ